MILPIACAMSCGTTPPQEASPTAASGPGLGGNGVDGLVEIRGHVPVWSALGHDTGPLADDEPIEHVTAVLTRTPQQEDGLQALLRDQVTRGSADYHHWVTPEEIADRFGASPEQLATVLAWVETRGLHAENVSRSRGFVTFSGTAKTLGAALSTEFHRFDVGDDRWVSVISEPRIPAEIAAAIRSFAGLSTIASGAVHHTKERKRIISSPEYSSGSQHFLAPADFAAIYDVNPVYADAIDGRGTAIAIVGRSRVDPNDVLNFQAITGATSKAPTVTIPPSGVDPGMTLDDDQAEATLDVTRAGSVAPGATIDLVVSGTPSTSMVDGTTIAIEYVVDNDVAPILSISFGECEALEGQSATLFLDSLFTQAAAEGISVFVSSGDAGVAGCAAGFETPPASLVAGINFMCASGSVTCVGGTEFSDQANPAAYWNTANSITLGSARSYIPEGAWNEPRSATSSAQLDASGGGASIFISKPSWQTAPGVPADGFRDTPDVAFAAACHDGYVVCLAFDGGDCSQGEFESFCGTSAAAPSMAGIMALVDQANSGAQGNFNPTLYALAPAASTSKTFHDVNVATSGVATCTATPSTCNNSVPGADDASVGLAGGEVQTGFDLVTGWGSLDVAALLDDLHCQDKPDGTACSDGNACTQADACHAGVCVGTPVVCTASDACHVAGTCSTTTGLCSSPASANGAPCAGGECTAGICVSIADGGSTSSTADASLDSGASPVRQDSGSPSSDASVESSDASLAPNDASLGSSDASLDSGQGSSSDGSPLTADASNSSETGAPGPDASNSAAQNPPVSTGAAGCSCTAAGRSNSGRSASGGAVLGLVLFARRRRSRRLGLATA
jgi:hypothetical protein